LDLHDIKLHLQNHFSDGLVTIVGSGLSCAEGLPSMTELANHLQTVIGGGLAAADEVHWKKLSPLIAAKGLEAAMLEFPPTQALEAAIVARTAELIGDREREIVSQVFAGKKTLRFTRLLPQLLKPQTGLAVVTPNYDRLIEIAAEEAGLGADTMFVGNFAGALNEQESQLSFCREVSIRNKQVRYRYRPRVIVFKPHGSLDWYHRDGKPVRYSGDLALPRLIITPGLNKFRNGYESPFDKHRDRANSAIDRAARFLIIGYGFNDDHLETHLTPRIRGGVKTLLLTHTLSPNAMKLARDCGNVIAIQRAVIGGKEGSSLFINKAEIQIADVAWWELDTFISEVFKS
jgi:hypothetical protein